VVYQVYIMASQSGVLYIGMTNDLFHRVSQHKSKTIPGFSQTYNTTKLVYFEPFQDVRNAIAREKQLKRWNRSKKIFLIEKQNPAWQDLYPTLIPTPK
jgi:putative endonuclease